MEQVEQKFSLSQFITREILLLQKFSLNAPDDIKSSLLTEQEWLDQFESFSTFPLESGNV